MVHLSFLKLKNLSFLSLTFIALMGCKGGSGGASSGGVAGTSTDRYSDVAADPLAGYLWHVKNVGQTNFSSLPTPETLGTDINLGDTHKSFRGAGYTVVVADGRIDLDHPDLESNTDLSRSKNYAIGLSAGISPTTSDDDDNHGTGVMGLIGASRGNGIGIYGISPMAKLVGLNFLDSDQSQSKQQDMVMTVFGGIYNFSFGSFTCAPSPYNSGLFDYIRWQTMNYNEIYVTSGGNDYTENRTRCGGSSGTYLGNGNLDQVKSLPYYIVVAATNRDGLIAEYSTPSSNTWISAPGGEQYGVGGLPLLTTDLNGCSKGGARSSSSIDFDKNQFGNNPNCGYVTNGSVGTSFAAPVVSGAVPLILENLSYSNRNLRTVKHVLASTARRVHPNSGNTSHPSGNNLAGHVYQNGWITNAAGYNFHNWYGFGLLDISAAVSFAKNFSGTLGQARETIGAGGAPFYSSGNINQSIPDNSAVGRTSSLSVNAHNLIVEHLLVRLNITHPWRGDLGVEITSPSGTVSKMLNINSNIVGANFSNLSLGSNAFYGEPSLGTWTIRVIDGAQNDAGTLNSWSIEILGRNQPTGSTVSPVTNITNTGNTISWTAPSGSIRRYEVAINSSSLEPGDHEWFSIPGASNSFVATKSSSIGWFNLWSGWNYKVYIRAIDTGENASEITTHTWTAP